MGCWVVVMRLDLGFKLTAVWRVDQNEVGEDMGRPRRGLRQKTGMRVGEIWWSGWDQTDLKAILEIKLAGLN